MTAATTRSHRFVIALYYAARARLGGRNVSTVAWLRCARQLGRMVRALKHSGPLVPVLPSVRRLPAKGHRLRRNDGGGGFSGAHARAARGTSLAIGRTNQRRPA